MNGAGDANERLRQPVRRVVRAGGAALGPTYHDAVTVVVAVLAGLLVGVVATAMVFSVRERDRSGVPAPPGPRPRRREPMPAETVLELLPTAAVLVDANDNVR